MFTTIYNSYWGGKAASNMTDNERLVISEGQYLFRLLAWWISFENFTAIITSIWDIKVPALHGGPLKSAWFNWSSNSTHNAKNSAWINWSLKKLFLIWYSPPRPPPFHKMKACLIWLFPGRSPFNLSIHDKGTNWVWWGESAWFDWVPIKQVRNKLCSSSFKCSHQYLVYSAILIRV